MEQNNPKEQFTAVRKNQDGDIQMFRTSTGRELAYPDAINEVQAGNIGGANVFTGRNGRQIIRGNADGDPSNNLDNLPQF